MCLCVRGCILRELYKKKEKKSMLNCSPLSKTCFLKMLTFYFCQSLYCVWLHVELPWKLKVVVEFDCTFPVQNNEHTIRYLSTNNEHTIRYLSTNTWTHYQISIYKQWTHHQVSIYKQNTPLEIYLQTMNTPLDICLQTINTPLDICLQWTHHYTLIYNVHTIKYFSPIRNKIYQLST